MQIFIADDRRPSMSHPCPPYSKITDTDYHTLPGTLKLSELASQGYTVKFINGPCDSVEEEEGQVGDLDFHDLLAGRFRDMLMEKYGDVIGDDITNNAGAVLLLRDGRDVACAVLAWQCVKSEEDGAVDIGVGMDYFYFADNESMKIILDCVRNFIKTRLERNDPTYDELVHHYQGFDPQPEVFLITTCGTEEEGDKESIDLYKSYGLEPTDDDWDFGYSMNLKIEIDIECPQEMLTS